MSISFFDDVYSETRFNWKRFIQTFFPAVILAVFILILIWVLNYFNPLGDNPVLNYIVLFLVNNWLFIVLFVFVFSVWDYLFEIFYNTKLRFLAPFFESVGIFFAIWIIAVIFNGLKLFLEPSHQLIPLFSFLYDFFYAQTILLFCFLLLIHYSKFFLYDKKR